MYFRLGPFRWPRGHIEAVRRSLPDKGGPGLSQKPLIAAIGGLLTIYRPGGG
jgi:hypothetical protein